MQWGKDPLKCLMEGEKGKHPHPSMKRGGGEERGGGEQAHCLKQLIVMHLFEENDGPVMGLSLGSFSHLTALSFLYLDGQASMSEWCSRSPRSQPYYNPTSVMSKRALETE